MLHQLLFLLAFLHVCIAQTTSVEYSEHLTLRPLPASSLLASFAFTSNTTDSAFESQNFRHFPRSLGQILQHTHTKELHLRFSTGRWDDEKWGARPWDGYKEGGTGVELWAWIDAATQEDANARWLGLTNALSGLFCASLNFIGATRTIRPVLAFEKQGDHGNATARRLHLLHGTLPGETVCTENLTPFVKALPCKGKAGISSLLDGHKLFDSSWQSMSIDVQPRCPSETSDCVVEIEQTIDMVLDIERSKRPAHDPIPRPLPIEQIRCDESKYYHSYGDSCYPLEGPSSPAFTISEVFGRSVQGSCPLADESGPTESLCVETSPYRVVAPKTSSNYSEHQYDGKRCHALPQGAEFDIDLAEQHLPPAQGSTSPLTVSRTLSGRGQQHGGFRTVFTNALPAGPLKVVFLEPVPWFMKPFLHTMAVKVSPINDPLSITKRRDLIEQIYYRPAVDRKRASHLEMVITIPAASRLVLTYDFEKSILRYTEYPPDANRGFNAASAIIRILSGPDGQARKSTYLRTTSLLLYLPTPDFSMPYNVIILSSTVIALAFGSIFNLLVRRLVAVDEVPEGKGLKGLIAAGMRAVVAKVGSVRGKFKGKSE